MRELFIDIVGDVWAYYPGTKLWYLLDWHLDDDGPEAGDTAAPHNIRRLEVQN